MAIHFRSFAAPIGGCGAGSRLTHYGSGTPKEVVVSDAIGREQLEGLAAAFDVARQNLSVSRDRVAVFAIFHPLVEVCVPTFAAFGTFLDIE